VSPHGRHVSIIHASNLNSVIVEGDLKWNTIRAQVICDISQRVRSASLLSKMAPKNRSASYASRSSEENDIHIRTTDYVYLILFFHYVKPNCLLFINE
jgi:hypothetical protein